jgi:SAM-dependent methyltransferase
MSEPASRWGEITGRAGGAEYAARFAELQASGVDVHGEARLCASLITPGSRVLDAGCGTGRVAIQMSEWGYSCVGVDSDDSMLSEARKTASNVDWLLADLAALDRATPALSTPFDLIVAAGNVIPLLSEDSERTVLANLASLLVPSGLLVAGFGLHADFLPIDWAPVDLATYDRWCSDHGMELMRRFSTWAGDRYTDEPYAVSVHRKT